MRFRSNELARRHVFRSDSARFGQVVSVELRHADDVTNLDDTFLHRLELIASPCVSTGENFRGSVGEAQCHRKGQGRRSLQPGGIRRIKQSHMSWILNSDWPTPTVSTIVTLNLWQDKMMNVLQVPYSVVHYNLLTFLMNENEFHIFPEGISCSRGSSSLTDCLS